MVHRMKQTQREPEMRRQRRDCESGVPGIGDATVEEWSKNPPRDHGYKAIIPKRLIHGKRAHQERLSFLHA